MNTAVAGVGLGLAVPIDAHTRRIIAALMSDGRVRRAYLGIGGGERPLPPRIAARLQRERGIEIVEVVEGCAGRGRRPAARGPPRRGGRQRALRSVSDLQRLMTGERIGTRVTLEVVRGADAFELELVPRDLDADPPALRR